MNQQHSQNTPIQAQVNAVFIHVKDLDLSARWYGEILGFEVEEKEIESPVFNLPIRGSTSVTLDDHTFDRPFEHNPSPYPICNFYTSNIDDAYEFIKEKKIEIVREIERIGDDFAWFNFKDPSGNVLMICNC